VIVVAACVVSSFAWLTRRIVERRRPYDPYEIDDRGSRDGFNLVDGRVVRSNGDLMARERGR
jgi:hypothetical protein